MANYCTTCKFFRENGSYDIPAPPGERGHNWHETGPHCEHNPEWVRVQSPEYHNCAYWDEKDPIDPRM